MGLIVQKYGGTSVGSIERIRAVAERIDRTHRQGHDLVVVVSAMGHTTDHLVEMAAQLCDEPDPREMDMLLTTGEQQSIALLCLALQARGCKAISLTGPQVGIVTEPNHSRARIRRIHTGRLSELVAAGYVVVVAGFQGLCHARFWEITTLGRGGSDTSAVALAAALKASRCEIYTDVAGVLTTDPRLVSDAALLDEITSEEMLELASLGAAVLHPRAVEIARNFAVPLVVRSSWSDAPGTIVQSPPLPVARAIDNIETERPVDAVFIDNNQAKIVLFDVPDRPGVAAELFRYLGDAGVDVDLIIQSIQQLGKQMAANDIAFTVQRSDLTAAAAAAEAAARAIGGCQVAVDDAITKVSIRGAGIIGRPGIVAQMFRALADADINIQMISTSEISLSCVIASAQATLAGEALCRQFGLREPVHEAPPVVGIAPPAAYGVRGVALDVNQAQVAILKVPDRPGVAAQIVACLAREGIPVDVMVQSQRGLATNDIGFTVSRSVARAAERALQSLCASFEGCGGVVVRDPVAKLSLVGAGIAGTPGVAHRMFETLATLGVNIEMISTSTIKVSCILDTACATAALAAVHAAFDLGCGIRAAVEGS